MKRSSKRRDRVKYVDPVTGLAEYRYVEKVTDRYEDEEKVPIITLMYRAQDSCALSSFAFSLLVYWKYF